MYQHVFTRGICFRLFNERANPGLRVVGVCTTKQVCASFGSYARNYLPTVSAVDSEIFVGR
jgi:hypothetical protein